MEDSRTQQTLEPASVSVRQPALGSTVSPRQLALVVQFLRDNQHELSGFSETTCASCSVSLRPVLVVRFFWDNLRWLSSFSETTGPDCPVSLGQPCSGCLVSLRQPVLVVEPTLVLQVLWDNWRWLSSFSKTTCWLSFGPSLYIFLLFEGCWRLCFWILCLLFEHDFYHLLNSGRWSVRWRTRPWSAAHVLLFFHAVFKF